MANVVRGLEQLQENISNATQTVRATWQDEDAEHFAANGSGRLCKISADAVQEHRDTECALRSYKSKLGAIRREIEAMI